MDNKAEISSSGSIGLAIKLLNENEADLDHFRA